MPRIYRNAKPFEHRRQSVLDATRMYHGENRKPILPHLLDDAIFHCVIKGTINGSLGLFKRDRLRFLPLEFRIDPGLVQLGHAFELGDTFIQGFQHGLDSVHDCANSLHRALTDIVTGVNRVYLPAKGFDRMHRALDLLLQAIARRVGIAIQSIELVLQAIDLLLQAYDLP